MLCPGCNKTEVTREALLEGKFRCTDCGADWRGFGGVMLLPRVLFDAGLSAARIGDWDTAERCLLVAVHMEPDLVTARVLLGKVYAHQDSLVKAISAWKQVLRQEKDNPAATRGIVWARARLRAQRDKRPPDADLVLQGNVEVTGTGWSAHGEKLCCRSTSREMSLEGKPAVVSLRDLVVEGKRLQLRLLGTEVAADRMTEEPPTRPEAPEKKDGGET